MKRYFLSLGAVTFALCLFVSNVPSQEVIERKDLILTDIKLAENISKTNITISQAEGGSLKITGVFELLMGGFAVMSKGDAFVSNSETGFREYNLLGIGATHRFKGKVEMQGAGFENYIFEGDENNPLEFACFGSKGGYKYVKGKGKVIMKKDRKVIKLGD